MDGKDAVIAFLITLSCTLFAGYNWMLYKYWDMRHKHASLRKVIERMQKEKES